MSNATSIENEFDTSVYTPEYVHNEVFYDDPEAARHYARPHEHRRRARSLPRKEFWVFHPDNRDQYWVGIGRRPKWVDELVQAGRLPETALRPVSSARRRVKSSDGADVSSDGPVNRKRKLPDERFWVRHPDDPNTFWVGIGRRPRWVTELAKSGRLGIPCAKPRHNAYEEEWKVEEEQENEKEFTF